MDLAGRQASDLVVQLLRSSFLSVEVEVEQVEGRSRSWVAADGRMLFAEALVPLSLVEDHLADVGCGVGMVSHGRILVVEEIVNCTSRAGSVGMVVSRPEMVAMHSLEQLDMGMVEEDLCEAIVACVDAVIACMDSTASVSL